MSKSRANRGRRQDDPPGVAARRAAARAVEGVVVRRERLETGLEGAPGFADMAARDRAFARLVAATAMRRLGQIDAVLKRFLYRPPPAPVRAILQCGAAELIFLDAPPHAAVSSAASLAASDPRTRPFKGLVNAVLRRVAEAGADMAAEMTPETSLPVWLWASWRSAYGEKTARAMVEAHLGEPPLDLTLKAARREVAIGLAMMSEGDVLPTGSIRLTGGGRVEHVPGFTEGLWWVQDAAAAMPARLLDARPGETVYDLCAAPGGKTMQLAATEAHVVAVDSGVVRLRRLRENLDRARLSAEIVAADVLKWAPGAQADAVLLDAPCSSTGTLRRSPDAAWIRRPGELPGLTALQDRMLDRATDMVRPGGRLVYCVCSLQPEEGEDRIAAFLARRPDMEIAPVRPAEAPGLRQAITKEGTLRILPAFWADRGGLDGFFAARMLKKP